tara:strand:+ start:114 stop:299 length:186 start_codon:yes stop_codon:yes gene_type:complete
MIIISVCVYVCVQLLSIVLQMAFALFESHTRVEVMHNDVKVRCVRVSSCLLACRMALRALL